MHFSLRNDALPADLRPELARRKFKLSAPLVAEVKRLKPLDDAFDKRIAPLDEKRAELETKYATAQDNARKGRPHVTDEDLDLIATFDPDDLRRRFAKTKAQIEQEREDFHRSEVRPTLLKCADELCTAINEIRADAEREHRDFCTKYGVPFQADLPALYSIARTRDTACASLRSSHETPCGVDQIRVVLGEISPI
jgi:hypothetical protein